MDEKEKKQNLVGPSIKKIVKEKGLTLKELAKRMKTQGSTLHQAMYGNPTIDMVERIAKALEVDIRVLFEGTGTEIHGIVQYKNHTYKIDSVESLKKLLSDIEKEA